MLSRIMFPLYTVLPYPSQNILMLPFRYNYKYIISFIPRSRYIAHFSARISHLTRHGVLINTHNTALYIAPRRICIIVPRNTHFCHLTFSLSLCVFNTREGRIRCTTIRAGIANSVTPHNIFFIQ